MSTITWPASLVPKTASLRLQTVQRVHASPFGGSEQTVDLLNDRWMLSLTLTQRAGFDWGAKAEAFIAALRGQTNTVALWHFARPTVRGTLASATCATVAQGADAVVLTGSSVDPYNGKCLRSSAGSIFSLPVVVDPDAAAVVSAIRDSGIEVLATALDASVDIRAADLSARTAWLFGPEAHGLPDEVMALASQRVHIPMRGSAESLNVAAAASICLYESSRAHS